MKRIIAKYLAKFATKETPRPLGRWSTERCAIKLDKKIDMSNEDHCGPCGEYAKTTADLHLRSFKTPPSGAVMSDEDDADCAFSMRKGVKMCKALVKIN